MKKKRKFKGEEDFGVNFIISKEPGKVNMEKLMASEKMKMANEVVASGIFSKKRKKNG